MTTTIYIATTITTSTITTVTATTTSITTNNNKYDWVVAATLTFINDIDNSVIVIDR